VAEGCAILLSHASDSICQINFEIITKIVRYWLETKREIGFFSCISKRAIQTACPIFSNISIV